MKIHKYQQCIHDDFDENQSEIVFVFEWNTCIYKYKVVISVCLVPFTISVPFQIQWSSVLFEKFLRILNSLHGSWNVYMDLESSVDWADIEVWFLRKELSIYGSIWVGLSLMLILEKKRCGWKHICLLYAIIHTFKFNYKGLFCIVNEQAFTKKPMCHQCPFLSTNQKCNNSYFL